MTRYLLAYEGHAEHSNALLVAVARHAAQLRITATDRTEARR